MNVNGCMYIFVLMHVCVLVKERLYDYIYISSLTLIKPIGRVQE
jgi:hypothetical protein